MFGSYKVRLEPELYRRAAEQARALGLSSVDAYVAQVLEGELRAAEEQALRDKVMEKMKGLGYLE